MVDKTDTVILTDIVSHDILFFKCKETAANIHISKTNKPVHSGFCCISIHLSDIHPVFDNDGVKNEYMEV